MVPAVLPAIIYEYTRSVDGGGHHPTGNSVIVCRLSSDGRTGRIQEDSVGDSVPPS